MKGRKNNREDLVGSVRQVFLLSCCLGFLLVPLQGQAREYNSPLDSLKAIVVNKSGKEKVDLLLEISRASWFISFEESLRYATQAYQIAKELDYLEGKADAFNRIGNVHYFLGNYENVIENYNMAVDIARSVEDFRRTGMYLNNIGLLYRELNRYDSAEVYLIRALRAKEQDGDTDIIASTLSNLGILYRDKESYNLSLEHFMKGLDILKETGDKNKLAKVHRDAGEILYLQKRYNESLKHFMNSLNYAGEISDSSLISSIYHNIGRSLLDMGNPETASEWIKKSLDMANAISSQENRRNSYQLFYNYHKKRDDHKIALDYFVRYSNLKDSIRNQFTDKQFEQLEGIFETEKQKSKIELLQKENQIQELTLKRQGFFRTSLTALLIILILFKVLFAYRFRMIQKTNRLLKQKIGELEKSNDKLRESSIALEQLNATKNRFFSIIAHDLKNPFNVLLGFSEMITSNFNQLKEEEINEYISIVHDSSHNLYKLLDNLLKWSAAQTGTIHYLPEQFDLVSLIHSEINFLRINASKKQINFSANLPDYLIIKSDKLLLSSVIRNLTDNAVKFTPAGGTITISARKDDHNVFVEVADTGMGIPAEIQDRLFRIDGNIGRKGTNNEKGGGLGLILCKELIEKSGGKIDFESTAGKGSRFWFRLPL